MIAAEAGASVTYLTQARTISATNTVDGLVQSKTAPDFASFVDLVSSSAIFVKPTGGTGTTSGGSGIDCQLDPNGVKLRGKLSAAGGLALSGGKPAVELGEAGVIVNLTFHLDEATAFALYVSPRPFGLVDDRFKFKFEGDVAGKLISITDKDPSQAVNLEGVLPAGDYALEFEAQFRGDGEEVSSLYELGLSIPTPGTLAMLPFAGLLARRRRA